MYWIHTTNLFLFFIFLFFWDLTFISAPNLTCKQFQTLLFLTLQVCWGGCWEAYSQMQGHQEQQKKIKPHIRLQSAAQPHCILCAAIACWSATLIRHTCGYSVLVSQTNTWWHILLGTGSHTNKCCYSVLVSYTNTCRHILTGSHTNAYGYSVLVSYTNLPPISSVHNSLLYPDFMWPMIRSILCYNHWLIMSIIFNIIN